MIKKIVAIGPESTGKSMLCELLARHFNTTWCPEYAREYLNQNGVKYGYHDLLKIAQGQLVIEDYCVERVSDQSSIVNRESSIVNRESSNSELRTQNPELRTQNPELRTQNSQLRTYNPELTTQNSELRTHHSPLTTRSRQILFLDTNMYVMKVWYEYVFGKCEQLILDEISKRKYDLYLLCNIDLPWTADEMREYPDERPRVELYNIYKDLLINQTTPWVEISGNYKERLQTAVGAVERIVLC